jgi:SPP1 gp7 family putative phage head morphogenesis protein
MFKRTAFDRYVSRRMKNPSFAKEYEAARIEIEKIDSSKYRAPYDSPIVHPETGDAYALADEHAPKMQRAWLNGVRNLGVVIERTVYHALTGYYYAPAATTAIDVSPEVRDAYVELKRGLSDKILSLWGDTYKQTRTVQKATEIILPDKENFEEELWTTMMGKPELYDAAVAFAESRSSILVTKVNADQTTQIRSAISDGVSTGQHPRVIARKIKDLNIGLAEKGPYTYDRVLRYKFAQEAAGVATDVVDKRVKRFYDKMLRKRAESIARTEMIRTQSTARRQRWGNEKAFVLITDGSMRVWISGVGERTCPRCVDMDGETAPLGQPYKNGSEGPPLHPMCRCTEAIRIA